VHNNVGVQNSRKAFMKIMQTPVVLAALSITTGVFAQNDSSPSASAIAPPSTPIQRSEADLEKLVAPSAPYPDPLLAPLLPSRGHQIRRLRYHDLHHQPAGKVYQKDLGPDTDSIVRQINTHDPDASWTVSPD
jgi:hypothetical protein